MSDEQTTTPEGLTTPEVEPPVRELQPVDVVVGNRVITYLGDEVVGEREITDVGEAPTGEHPATPEPQPEAVPDE